MGSGYLGNCHLGSRSWENAFGKERDSLTKQKEMFLESFSKFEEGGLVWIILYREYFFMSYN